MLYKRSTKPGAHWWVRFSIKGQEVRQSSGTDRKESAEAFEQQLREAIWDEQNLGIEVHTWEEACEQWYKDKAKKKSLIRDRQAIARLNLSGDLEGIQPPSPGAVGTRELAVYRSIMNAACHDWQWLAVAPKVKMPETVEHDPRWIKPEKFVTLIKELPPHAQQMARFGAATGMRSSNVRKLKWDSIHDKTAYVASLSAKAKKPIGIPLNADALAILRQQAKAHPVYVFTDHLGRAPVGSLKTCWGKARVRAGIPDFKFHDLRHTWAAWHTLKGTPPIILKELGGWSSLAMVEKYGHINPGHLADWADNSKIRRTKSGTRKNGQKRKTL
jgi:integrase